jgi:hypothetical protein
VVVAALSRQSPGSASAAEPVKAAEPADDPAAIAGAV